MGHFARKYRHSATAERMTFLILSAIGGSIWVLAFMVNFS